MMCPFCGAERAKGRLEHQMLSPAVVKENDLKKRRIENRSHNKQTMEMVGAAKITEPEVEMIEVKGKSSKFSGGSEQVPKIAVETLAGRLLK